MIKFRKFAFKKLFGLVNLIFVALIISCSPDTKEGENLQPPVAEKVPYELPSISDKRIDHYYWMRLTDSQKNAPQKDEQTQKVINYLNAENNYLKEKMKDTEKLQKKLYDEMVGRIPQTDESVPYEENGYWYYTRYEQGQEYPVYC